MGDRKSTPCFELVFFFWSFFEAECKTYQD